MKTYEMEASSETLVRLLNLARRRYKYKAFDFYLRVKKNKDT